MQQLSDDDDDGQGLMYYPMDKRLNSKFLSVGVLLTPLGEHELMLNNHQATNIGINCGSRSTELILSISSEELGLYNSAGTISGAWIVNQLCSPT